MSIHQYIERSTGKINTEVIYADKIINFIYSNLIEEQNIISKIITGRKMSSLLGYLNYDSVLGSKLINCNTVLLQKLKINLSECYDDPATLDTPRKIFERKINYWTCRPMEPSENIVVSPADSKMLCGSLNSESVLFTKEKFFSYKELLGIDKEIWLREFDEGDFAIFRLTPDKYHYNHVPASGIIVDHYEIDGEYHSCNPNAVIRCITPYSKNKRIVTIIDTDCEGGDQVGLIAMIEIVAMMIGEIEQVYSEYEYRNPVAMRNGMFLKRGCPKSLFRPGSSTVVLFFQKSRIEFEKDILENLKNPMAVSRFSSGFNQPLIETDLMVRSTIARKCGGD